MNEAQRKPFMERFNELLAIAVMRNGYIGSPGYYGALV